MSFYVKCVYLQCQEKLVNMIQLLSSVQTETGRISLNIQQIIELSEPEHKNNGKRDTSKFLREELQV